MITKKDYEYAKNNFRGFTGDIIIEASSLEINNTTYRVVAICEVSTDKYEKRVIRSDYYDEN